MTNRLFKRFREAEPATEAAAGNAKSPREALNEQWLRIRAGLGGSDAIDSMDAVYRAELRDLRSAERQACALVDEIWVTLLNAPLAERVSQYVAALRRRTAEYAGETHRNPNMSVLVNETSRVAENCATSVRDVVLLATLQHMVHNQIASYRQIAAHEQELGRAEQAALFDGYAEADRQFDLDLSSLARNEVNPQALAKREPPH
jgi:ferritin-like metal-binding protein YciE